MNCPLCNTPMIVKPLIPEAKNLYMRSSVYCGKCGHGLKEAYQARLANLPERHRPHVN